MYWISFLSRDTASKQEGKSHAKQQVNQVDPDRGGGKRPRDPQGSAAPRRSQMGAVYEGVGARAGGDP